MSSSSLEQNVVQYFNHVHPLTKVDNYGEFTCGGCKTYGFGKTYRCASCNYDIHDHCATCPFTLLSFMHPQHELQLMFNGPDQLMCNICQGLIEGTYYNCAACAIDFHPLCTKQRQFVRYMPHPAHILELSQCGTSNMCMVCQCTILSWRYKCDSCTVNVHLECVDSSIPAASGIQQKSIGSQLDLHPPDDQECGHTNKGEGQVSGPSKRRKVFTFMRDLTVDTVCSFIADNM